MTNDLHQRLAELAVRMACLDKRGDFKGMSAKDFQGAVRELVANSSTEELAKTCLEELCGEAMKH